MIGILHDGAMIGNERNTERNLPKNLLAELRLLLLFAGCKETGMRTVSGTGDCGGGCGVDNDIASSVLGDAIMFN
jgi:hypothetical protein